MITIAIVNRKGGVGKTTTAVSLGGAYARAGLRCLLIDLDPQASLTHSFRLDRLPAGDAAALFDEAQVLPPERLIVPTAFEGLSILPGSASLDRHNHPDPAEFAGREYALRELKAGADFDRILIDCPPNLYLLSWAAMIAADYVLTPTRADRFGVQAIEVVNRAVAAARAKNSGLVQLGYILSVHKKRSSIHTAYAESLRHRFPGLVLENAVPDAAAFLEASAMQTPVGFCKPRSEAAKAVGRVAEEIETRIEMASAKAAA